LLAECREIIGIGSKLTRNTTETFKANATRALSTKMMYPTFWISAQVMPGTSIIKLTIPFMTAQAGAK
jgi:hypothetical protein